MIDAKTQLSGKYPMDFTSLHIASGTNVASNILFVPAGQKYTIENIYLQNETAGTMVSVECPNDGLMLAHNKPATGGLFNLQFSNLDAVIDGGVSGVQCIADREGAGTNEHTYYQIQYYPFDVFATSSPALNFEYKPVEVYQTYFIDFLFVILTGAVLYKIFFD